MSQALDPEFGKLLLHQWFQTFEESDQNLKESLARSYELLNKVIIEITDRSGLQFHTMFTRMAFIGTTFKLPPALLFNLHVIRKEISAWLNASEEQKQHSLALLKRSGADLISSVFGNKLSNVQADKLPSRDVYLKPEWSDTEHIAHARVELTKIDAETKLLYGLPRNGSGEVRIRYNVTGKNDQFNSGIEILQKHFQLPQSISLIDIEVRDDGSWIPCAIIILPDYLLDVTAVAETLKEDGCHTEGYLLRKYLPLSNSVPILLGNIVNFFLDELVSDPEKSFSDLKSRLFKLAPLTFATISDSDLRTFFEELQVHYLTLKKLATGGFQSQGIIPEKSILEPTFFSEKYGLQGRLDMFHRGEQHKGAIIELKSGKIFKPNKYGLNQSHYLQTLLYDLLIQSVFENKIKPTSYILYSGDPDNPLRFAPVVKAQQYEALSARNELIGIEKQIANLTDETDPETCVYQKLKVLDLKGLYGFTLRDVQMFEKVYHSLSDMERRYFNAFAGMISREHILAKVGISGKEGSEGQAALWQKSAHEKEQAFELMRHLRIGLNQADAEDPIVVLHHTELTNPLANFRLGDIVVMYPQPEDEDTGTFDQLIKSTIVAMDHESLTLRLRARQTNLQHFERHDKWHIEQDLLDSSFMGLSRSLFEFAHAPKEKREKILSLLPPNHTIEVDVQFPDDLTEEQKKICSKIIAAPDYFLLWGPPGTGKTSKMLHHIVRYLLENTNEKLLLMAYTNRAVDEMCEAIESIHADVRSQYLRIGSRYGVRTEYQPRLLDTLASGCKTRQELLDMLSQQRIVLGTVASLQGKPELFNLIHFDRLLVDEASQIIEPSLAGFMTRFEKVLLIGDHLQLPAVVTQDKSSTMVKNQELKNIGLKDLRDSLFERLYLRSQAMGWDWAYARLSHQGRMHEDIMAFPNQIFYKGGLKILPLNSDNHFQKKAIGVNNNLLNNENQLWNSIINKRVNFLQTPIDKTHLHGKINRHEARLIAELIPLFRELYQDKQISIGVITPYRSQIATILHTLQNKNIELGTVQIDTVERFQGAAKDVVILSLCLNNKHQLANLVSLSAEGVDRKFNVALTRARQHLVVLGNPEILKLDERYKAFMEMYG